LLYWQYSPQIINRVINNARPTCVDAARPLSAINRGQMHNHAADDHGYIFATE